jgi:hypothetical protein
LKNDLNQLHSAGLNPAHSYSARLDSLPRAADRKAGWALAWWPGPAAGRPGGVVAEGPVVASGDHREGAGQQEWRPGSLRTAVVCEVGVVARCGGVWWGPHRRKGRRRLWLAPGAVREDERGEGGLK